MPSAMSSKHLLVSICLGLTSAAALLACGEDAPAAPEPTSAPEATGATPPATPTAAGPTPAPAGGLPDAIKQAYLADKQDKAKAAAGH